MASLAYAGLGFGLGAPFFAHGDRKLDLLWQIYRSPMFDQAPVLPLAFSALASIVLCLQYLSKYFFEFSSRPLVGQISAVLSFALLINALVNFGQHVVYMSVFATFFTLWAWWRSDPEDSWF